MPQRKAIRRHILERRKNLSGVEQRIAAEQITHHITSQHEFNAAWHIAFYKAFDGEIDPAQVLEKSAREGKHCYLPILHPVKHNSLWFMPYKPGDELRLNRFGIAEPIVDLEKLIEPWSLDLVFMPLVAFDKQGNRLGMGQGYYDRTFTFMREQHFHKPLLVGLAYEWQQQKQIKAEDWDVPLAAVATEENFHRF